MNNFTRIALLVGVGAFVLWLERRYRARPYVEHPVRHIGRNLTFAGVAAATVHLLETPVVLPASFWVAQHQWGVTRFIPAPGWLRMFIAVLLLDYSLYVWHILTHRVSFLWRFHLVHHVDLDLDASTGLRFHAGELALSVPWRVAQIAAIGVTPGALVAWQTLTLASVLFHHSNSRLHPALEAVLTWLLVTPRMHAIHHSIDPAQTNSNFSSGLAIWDRLHGTLRLDAQADEVTIGVAGYRDPLTLGIGRVLGLPFSAQPPPPAGGE